MSVSTSTDTKNHNTAIAYTAAFLGLLLVMFLFVVFFTSSTPAQGNKANQQFINKQETCLVKN